MAIKPLTKTAVQMLTAGTADAQRRIDNYLMARLKGVPRTRIYQMLRKGEVRVNRGRVRPDYRLEDGDQVRIPPVTLPERESPGQPPVYLQRMLDDALLYEDRHMLVLNKPSGIVVHGGSGRTFGIIEVLRHQRPDEHQLQLVHRLDQATSGCLLLSKTPESLRTLQKEFVSGKVTKKYLALLKGDIGEAAVQVDRALKKNVVNSGERMVRIDNAGKSALTRLQRKAVYRDSCLAEASIVTGRTHQIRVHAMHLGHPVAGDEKYGDGIFNKRLRRGGLKRLFLHASRLELRDLNGKKRGFHAPLAADLEEFLSSHE